MEMLELDVSQHDIDNGFPGRPGLCPIARSVRRRVPGASNVQVTNTSVCFRDPAKYFRLEVYSLDPVGTHFIRNFDLYNKVEPLTLKLTSVKNNG